jgi:hypothetical protein
MKTTVKVTTTSVKTIELPKYFKSTHYEDMYFMILDDKNYVRIHDRVYNRSYCDGPSFTIVRNETILGWTQEGIEEITEQEFQSKFKQMYFKLSELVNL